MGDAAPIIRAQNKSCSGRLFSSWFHTRVWIALIVSALVAVATATDAAADTMPSSGVPVTVSADALPTWQINGVVWSQIVVNNIVYATGSFTKARPPGVPPGGVGEVSVNNLFAYDIRTGSRVAFNHSLNAQGRVVTTSPDGLRLFIGGDFTTVDGVVRNHVATFDLANGTLNTAIRPSVSSSVRALAASASTLFIGGGFASVNGLSRQNLSAVSIPSGSLLPWSPSAQSGAVWSMVLSPDKTRLVVGGSFTSLSGKPAYGMGALNASTGGVLPWAANATIRDATSTGAITSLRTDGVKIYGSGYAFGAGSNFEGTFAADPTTGKLLLVNDCHGDTYDVLPLGPVLYSVSHAHDCSAIGSFPDTSPRARWQRALAETTSATGTNKGPDSYGWNYNGLPASTVLQWFPDLSAGTYTGQFQAAWSITGNTSYIALGGEFPAVNGRSQQGLVRMAVSPSAPNKRGPTYSTKPPRAVPATTVARTASGRITVTYGTAWDQDNQTLTYEVIRDGVIVINTATVKTNFWTLPNRAVADTVRAGTTHTYQVRIKDPFGNTLMSPKSNAVTA
jgi:hypothetical protein